MRTALNIVENAGASLDIHDGRQEEIVDWESPIHCEKEILDVELGTIDNN